MRRIRTDGIDYFMIDSCTRPVKERRVRCGCDRLFGICCQGSRYDGGSTFDQCAESAMRACLGLRNRTHGVVYLLPDADLAHPYHLNLNGFGISFGRIVFHASLNHL